MRKLTGTVKDGSVAVDLPDGTPVTVTVDESWAGHPGPRIELDANGHLIMTPELEAELAIAEAEAARGEGIPLPDFLAWLRSLRAR